MTAQKALPKAPLPEPIPRNACPVMAFQAMISGKYKIRILWDLKDGPRRYSEIRTGLLRGADGTAEIAPRVLSRELKALTNAGLIARKDYGLVPPKVEYRLTEAGGNFTPIIASIRDWGERHLRRHGGRRLGWVCARDQPARRHGVRSCSILPTTKVSTKASVMVPTREAKTFGIA